MRLVEDDGVGTGQELDKTLLLHRKIRQQEVVVHDDEVGFLRCTACFDHVAFLVDRAFTAKTVVSSRRDKRPDARIFRNLDQFGAIAGLCPVSPLPHRVQVIEECGRRYLAGNGVEPMQAKIVGTAFQQRRFDWPTCGLADQWQVSMVELVLQGLGPRRYDCLPPALQRGQQIGKSLARAGTGLDDKLARRSNRLGHGLCHPCLAFARLESGQMRFERAVRAEKFNQGNHCGNIRHCAHYGASFFGCPGRFPWVLPLTLAGDLIARVRNGPGRNLQLRIVRLNIVLSVFYADCSDGYARAAATVHIKVAGDSWSRNYLRLFALQRPGDGWPKSGAVPASVGIIARLDACSCPRQSGNRQTVRETI